MIILYAKTDAKTWCLTLPHGENWAVSVPRVHSSRVALGGNTIHQTILKDPSGGSARYSREVDPELAREVADLDEATSTCLVSDGEKLYEMILDARAAPGETPGKKLLTIDFWVVRRILP